MKKFFFTLVFICSFPLIYAQTPLGQRIYQLLPELTSQFKIEPSLPENYEAIRDDVSQWTYWGPKKIVNAYLQNPQSLGQSILRIKKANMTQNEIEHPNIQKLKKEFRAMGFKTIKHGSVKWGSYPVFYLEASSPYLPKMLIGWVGLNNDANEGLMFHLIYPENQKEPGKEDLQLWSAFLQKTRGINPGEVFEALEVRKNKGLTVQNEKE